MVNYLVDLGQGITLEMILIPGGTFTMGSFPNEPGGCFDNEHPQHQVTLPLFWMAKYPITQDQYQSIIGDNPSYFKGGNRPVERVSWHDAMKFCNRLSKKLGQPYTLPSEAEWEYACRAETTTPFYFGETITTNQANYDGNFTYGSGPEGGCRGETTEVGTFPPNSFGLCDMHGNVFEWCFDHYHDSYNGAPADGSAWVDAEAKKNKYRILRGGSWSVAPRICRCAYRFNADPDNRYLNEGFRVVGVPPKVLG